VSGISGPEHKGITLFSAINPEKSLLEHNAEQRKVESLHTHLPLSCHLHFDVFHTKPSQLKSSAYSTPHYPAPSHIKLFLHSKIFFPTSTLLSHYHIIKMPCPGSIPSLPGLKSLLYKYDALTTCNRACRSSFRLLTRLGSLSNVRVLSISFPSFSKQPSRTWAFNPFSSALAKKLSGYYGCQVACAPAILERERARWWSVEGVSLFVYTFLPSLFAILFSEFVVERYWKRQGYLLPKVRYLLRNVRFPSLNVLPSMPRMPALPALSWSQNKNSGPPARSNSRNTHQAPPKAEVKKREGKVRS
jgi:hypothetical protein